MINLGYYQVFDIIDHHWCFGSRTCLVQFRIVGVLNLILHFHIDHQDRAPIHLRTTWLFRYLPLPLYKVYEMFVEFSFRDLKSCQGENSLCYRESVPRIPFVSRSVARYSTLAGMLVPSLSLFLKTRASLVLWMG